MCSERLAVVTGANKGLGLAIVTGLCENFQGIVCLTSRDESRGLQATKVLEDQGLKCVYHQLDITDLTSILNFTEFVRINYGRIDVLVNNAGILFLKDATESKIYQAEETVAVNFSALVNFTEAVLPLIQNSGKIVNISSSSGHLSRIPSQDLRNEFMKPSLTLEELKTLMGCYLESVRANEASCWGDSPYVVSKVGVNAYTFILHRRLADKGVSVNCVHPGYVTSDMTRGVGSVTPARGSVTPLALALGVAGGSGGYWWSSGVKVEWGGKDPRGYIDGKELSDG